MFRQIDANDRKRIGQNKLVLALVNLYGTPFTPFQPHLPLNFDVEKALATKALKEAKPRAQTKRKQQRTSVS